MAAHMTRKAQIVVIPSQQDKEERMGEKCKQPLNLPRDVVFNILGRVPATSVYDLRFVEKPLRDLICSDPDFVEAYLLQANQDPGWIMETSNPLKGKDMFDTYWMKVEEGKIIRQKLNITHRAVVTVLATCNGLLLLKMKTTLCVINPVTKQQMKVPLHACPHGFANYALAFVPSTGKYKVLYYSPGIVHGGCLILTLGSYTWDEIDEPSDNYGKVNFYIDQCHLSVIGIVHWKIIFFDQNGRSYILSTDANSEKFHKTYLPEESSCNSSRPSGFPLVSQLLEMRGYLAFSSTTERFPDKMCIWILEDLHSGIWRRHQMIDLQWLREKNLIKSMNGVNVRPVISLQDGRVIILSNVRDECIRFIALNIESSEFTFVDVMKNVRKDRWLPHVMSIVPLPRPEVVKRKKHRIFTGK